MPRLEVNTISASERLLELYKNFMLIVLGSVTPDLYQHRDELSRFIGDEITRAINEQRTLEKRYEELMTQRADLKVSFPNTQHT